MVRFYQQNEQVVLEFPSTDSNFTEKLAKNMKCLEYLQR